MRVTYVHYPSFPTQGRILAWLVAFGSVLALGSLAIIILRLYISPILTPKHARRKRNA